MGVWERGAHMSTGKFYLETTARYKFALLLDPANGTSYKLDHPLLTRGDDDQKTAFDYFVARQPLRQVHQTEPDGRGWWHTLYECLNLPAETLLFKPSAHPPGGSLLLNEDEGH